MRIYIYVFVMLLTLLSITSILPVNQAIDNQNKDGMIKNQKSIGNHLTNLNKIINNQSFYSFGDTIIVNDIVNGTYYYNNVLNTNSFNSSQRYYIPAQNVEVYLGYNPCVSRNATDYCVGQNVPNPVNDYKLAVNSGNARTKGNDSNGDGIDDHLGIYQANKGISLATYYNGLSYNFSVATPTQTYYNTYISSSASVTLYEYYPGNKSLSIPDWLVNNKTITFSSDSAIHFTPSKTAAQITSQFNTTSIDFHAYLAPSTNFYQTQVVFNITNPLNSNATVCNSISSCNTAGFKVTQYGPAGTYNGDPVITDPNGVNTITVGFASIPSIVAEGNYYLVAKAVLINPSDANAKNWALSYSITSNKIASVKINVKYNYQSPLLTKTNVPSFSTTMYPFSTIANTNIRPGDYFSVYIRQTVNGTTSVANAPLKVNLFDVTNSNANITSQLSSYGTLTYPSGTLSNSNGYTLINFTLLYSIPLHVYNIVFSGNYAGMLLQYPTWINTTTSQNSLSYQFTANNLYDTATLHYVKALPSTLINPTTSLTTMYVEYQAYGTYNSVYYNYSSNYHSLSPTYPLVGLPVSPNIINFIGGPLAGIGVFTPPSTDSNGYINISLTTQYPNLYLDTTFQLNVTANLGSIITPSAYRFLRGNSAGTTNTTFGVSSLLAFNPNYVVVNAIFLGSNITNNQIRPGDWGYFKYKTFNNANGIGIAGVPFNDSITIGFNTPGILFYSNSSWLTQTGGIFFLLFKTYYGIINETISPLNITVKIILDIKAFNATMSDAYFYIGTKNLGNSTFNNFYDTWTEKYNSFNVNASYIYGKPVWIASVTDSHVLNSAVGYNLVRPDNETIRFSLKLQFINGTMLKNYKFPVLATLYSTYTGELLTIANATAFPEYGVTGYYYTNSSGYIDFIVTFNYNPTISKTDTIFINATVDFAHGQCVSACNPNLLKWIVGQDKVPGYNRSQASTSTIKNPSNLLVFTKNPAYVFGSLVSVSVTPSRVQPGKSVTLFYRAYIPSTDTNAGYDSLTTNGNLPIKGIKVYLNETVLSLYNMTLVQNGRVTDSNGIANFTVGIKTTTNEALYQIPAYADFEKDQSMQIGVTNRTGTFSYLWLNGTISTTGYYNKTASLTIKNYSPANSTNIDVKRAHTTDISVLKIYTFSNTVTNPVTTEVLRGYSLLLNVSYTDQFNAPLSGSQLKLNFTTVSQAGFLHSDVFSIGTTNAQGFIIYNATVKNSYNVGDGNITAFDPSNTSIYNINALNVRVLAQLSFTNLNFGIRYGSNEAMVGENISISGSITDDNNTFGTNYYSSSILQGELNNNLRVAGYDAGNTLIPGSTVSQTFTFNPTTVTFSFNWQVPQSYLGQILSIHVYINQNGSIIYFASSQSYHSVSLPTAISSSIHVFQSINYIFSIDPSSATGISLNGSIINLKNGYTGAVNVNGTLKDNWGNSLSFRTVNFKWNSTLSSTSTDNTGFFTYSGIIPANNVNTTYVFRIYYIASNGSIIDTYVNNLIRMVHDTTAPWIYLNNKTFYNNYVYANVTFNLTISDPSSINNNLVAESGINTNSAALYQNGTLIWNKTIDPSNIWNGTNMLPIPWAYNLSLLTGNTYVFVFYVSDKAGNTNSTTFYLKIDHIKPIFYNVTPSTDSYLYQTNYIFTFQAYDNQTGLNTTTAVVHINSQVIPMTLNGNNIFESSPVSFYRNETSFTVYFEIKDLAGNTNTTVPITILPDTLPPSIQLSSSNLNGQNAMHQTVTFTFTVTDGQTGVNGNNIYLYNSNNQIVLSPSSFSISGNPSSYTISGVLQKSDFNLSKSIQVFNFTVYDLYGNIKSYSFTFNIDIVGPSVSGTHLYQPKGTELTPSTTNANNSIQYIQFDLTDFGSPTTGVNISYAVIILTLNGTQNITLTYQNGVLTVSNSSLTGDFNVTLTNTTLFISWNATNIGSYGFKQTYSKQQISVAWQLVSLRDNFGNNLITNAKNIINYKMDIAALPPPPDIVAEIAGLALTFGIFILVGLAAAYLFEKIRYVG